MSTLNDKRILASSYILSLILDCQKHEADKIQTLSNAFLMLSPSPSCGIGFDLDEEEGPQPACVDTPIPYELATPQPALEVAPDPVTTPVVTAPAPTAKKAVAKKAAAKKEAPAPAAEIDPVVPEATDTGKPLTPGEAERFRALIRDTYAAKTKLIAKDDPDNARRIDYTAKFSATVESFGSKTVSTTAADDLPALLDAVRAIQA